MSQSISYRIGKAFGGLPKWARLVVIALVVAFLYKMCSSSSSTRSPQLAQMGAASAPANAASTAMERAAVQLVKQTEACQNSIPQRRATYTVHMKERRYWDAAIEMRECARLLAEPELVALVKDAEVKLHLAEINGAKTSPRAKVRAIEMLARDYPDVGSKYQAEIPKLMAAAERQEVAAARQEAAAQARRKRSEGVRIGMSKADILASRWGRPERVNRTTTAYGTREQWVYGNGNYLYLEDGVLVSVQN